MPRGGWRRGRLLLPHCTVPLMHNVAQADSIIERERSVVAGTRSDLLITHSNGDKLVIEVVHTHDMEEATATAYSKSGIPVLKIRPVWLPQDDGPDKVVSEPGYDGLALDVVAVAYDALNVTPRFCVGCKEGIKREDEEDDALKRKQDQELYHSITSDLKKKVASIPANVIPCAVRWEKDPFGDCLYLYPSIQNQLGNYGDKLLAMGFVQATEKHWLFFIKLIRGVIFADFGGAPAFPVLQYSGAIVYSNGLPPGVADRIEDHTSKLLKAIGIPMLHDLCESNPERRLLYPRTKKLQRREQERQRREQERQRREVKRHSQQLRALVNANPEDRKKYLEGLWAADKPVK